MHFLNSTGLAHLLDKFKTLLAGKQDTLVGSGDGQNIKTIGGQSLPGSGDIPLAAVATSGSYNDLTDTPDPITVDAEVSTESENPVQNKAITTALTTGISMLSSSFAEELEKKADLKHTHTKSEITDFPSLAAVATSGSYADLTDTPTIPAVPVISTDIATDKASTTKTAAPKAVYDEVHPATVSAQPSGGMLPNRLYKLGTLTGAVTFAMASAPDSDIINHWFWTFDTGTTAPTITWPGAITSWYGGEAPAIEAGKHYEVSVLEGVAICMEV